MAAYYTYNFLPPISSDLDSLLHDFEQESNHDYKSFASIWREHKLELLFKAVDIQPNSFRFFLDDSMTVAAAYLGEPWRVPVRLGALYSLFTLYMYQIEEPKIKIRLTIETWTSFLDQMESSAMIPQDAKIILSKLIAEHAFVTSATRHEMGPRFFTKINYMKSSKYMRSDVLLASRLNVDEKLVKLCEETHTLYTKAKESVMEACGGANHLPEEYTSIRTNFIEQLRRGLDIDEGNEQQPPPPPPQESAIRTTKRQSSVAERRSRIRAKGEATHLQKIGATNSVKYEFMHDDDNNNNKEEEEETNELRPANDDDDNDNETFTVGKKTTKAKAKATRRRSKKK